MSASPDFAPGLCMLGVMDAGLGHKKRRFVKVAAPWRCFRSTATRLMARI